MLIQYAANRDILQCLNKKKRRLDVNIVVYYNEHTVPILYTPVLFIKPK